MDVDDNDNMYVAGSSNDNGINGPSSNNNYYGFIAKF